jgi:hypothetical protein
MGNTKFMTTIPKKEGYNLHPGNKTGYSSEYYVQINIKLRVELTIGPKHTNTEIQISPNREYDSCINVPLNILLISNIKNPL